MKKEKMQTLEEANGEAIREDFKDAGLEFEVKSVSASQICKVIGSTKKL